MKKLALVAFLLGTMLPAQAADFFDGTANAEFIEKKYNPRSVVVLHDKREKWWNTAQAASGYFNKKGIRTSLEGFHVYDSADGVVSQLQRMGGQSVDFTVIYCLCIDDTAAKIRKGLDAIDSRAILLGTELEEIH